MGLPRPGFGTSSPGIRAPRTRGRDRPSDGRGRRGPFGGAFEGPRVVTSPPHREPVVRGPREVRGCRHPGRPGAPLASAARRVPHPPAPAGAPHRPSGRPRVPRRRRPVARISDGPRPARPPPCCPALGRRPSAPGRRRGARRRPAGRSRPRDMRGGRRPGGVAAGLPAALEAPPRARLGASTLRPEAAAGVARRPVLSGSRRRSDGAWCRSGSGRGGGGPRRGRARFRRARRRRRGRRAGSDPRRAGPSPRAR